MELSEALSQFKQSLAKYSAGPLLHLSEAAEKLKVTEKYLVGLALSGKIKAYKVGEHWFMEEKWLEDFRRTLRGHLERETSLSWQVSHRKGWSRQLPRRRLDELVAGVKPAAVAIFQTALASFALALVGIGFSLFCLPLAQISANRSMIASSFISATYSVYGAPSVLAERLRQGMDINDERITQAIYRLAGKNPPGQVAGVYEEVRK